MGGIKDLYGEFQYICLVFLCLFFCLVSYGDVRILKGLPESGKVKISNDEICAEFSASGGRLTSLVDLESGRDFVWRGGSSGGACKDQFPPAHYDYRNSRYRIEVVENTPSRGVIRLVSPKLSGRWQFLEIERTYTLEQGQRMLTCRLSLRNQPESMTSMQLEYWHHSFLGVPDEETRFIVPMESGVESIIPSQKNNDHFFYHPVRGWLAMLGRSGSGVAVMPEFRRLNMAYSWWCRDASPLDTLEWRLVPETVNAGESLETYYSIGLINDMKQIDGVGDSGCGAVVLPEKPYAGDVPLTVELYGFRSCKAELQVMLQNRKLRSLPVELKAGRKVSVPVVLEKMRRGSWPLVVRVVDVRTKKLLFDLIKVLHIDGDRSQVVFRPLEKRLASVKEQEPWQFTPSAEIVTPHCRWLEGAVQSVLVLMPVKGLRDVIEMQQRMPLSPVIPTLFPRSWNMSWRRECVLPPGTDKNGTEYVADFLKKDDYKAFVFGTEVRAAWDKERVFWTSYPSAVRKEILKKVKQGAGLFYINPSGEDQDLKEILAGLSELNLKDSMDYRAAPFFDKTRIYGGSYGKGRIAVVRYPSQGFLSPQSGGRSNVFQLLEHDHRYQEYQFAILCRLLNWCMGAELILKKVQWDAAGLEIVASRPGKATLEFFDRYSKSTGVERRMLSAGRNILKIAPKQNGRNFVHVKFEGKDCGYATLDYQSPVRIVGIESKAWFGQGEEVTGRVMLSSDIDDSRCRVQVSIYDQTGRLVHKQQGCIIRWNQKLARVNRHVICAELYKDGRMVDRCQKAFNLPEQFNVVENYSNLLWAGNDLDPEYSIPYHWEAARRFGFNFLYAGSTAEQAFCRLMQVANMEIGANCLAPGLFHSSEGLADWQKTHDPKFLIRPRCPSRPDYDGIAEVERKIGIFENFGTRHLFQLGDEMSMTYYNTPWDICFCSGCLAKFRKWLSRECYSSLQELNQDWMTSFKTWDDVMPMTRIQVLMHGSVSPWVKHRLFMDHVFAESLQQICGALQKKYPGAIVGPTGVNHPPHAYGGNWNFWNMRDFGCVSMYGTGRIPLSFNRDRRLVMQYRGYADPEAVVNRSFWEGVIAGERGSNNWYEPIFVLPDLRESQVRRYYSDILWELRSGVGDLFYHSRKITEQVAILHSQNSVLANFLKQRKTDYYQKEMVYARCLEDTGIPYRFVAPEEIRQGILKKFSALILPEASAMSGEEIQAVEQFVTKDGGILMADYEPAAQTENCNPRKIPALDKLFGVRTGVFSLRKVKSHNLPGFDISFAGRGIKVTDGHPRFRAVTDRGEVPLVICRKNGRGKAVLLNFAATYDKSRENAQDMGLPKLLVELLEQQSPVRVEAPVPVMHGLYRNQNAFYIGLMPVPPRGDWEKMPLSKLRKKAFMASLSSRTAGWLYDVRRGRNLGQGQHFKVVLTPADGTVLALLPYEVRDVKLTMPQQIRRGKILSIEAQVEAERTPGHHVLLMTVKRPDGTDSLEYRTIRSTSDGRWVFRIPFALNDPRGQWIVTIREATSGVTVRRTVEVD